jgi:ATP/maltotriose-dependent transcriptional regulator MalT
MVALATDGFYRLEYESMQSWAVAAAAGAARLDNPALMAAAESMITLACSFTEAIEEAMDHRLVAAKLVDHLTDDELSDRLDAIGHLAAAEVHLERFEEAAAHSQRGIAVARARGQDDMFPMLYPSLGVATWVLGRLAESAEILDTATESARLAGNTQSIAWSLLNRALCAVIAGDLELARRTAEESVALLGELGESYVAQLGDIILAWVLAEHGEPGRAAELMVAAGGGDDLPKVGGGWRATFLEVLVRCGLALGRLDRAKVAADGARTVAQQTGLPRSTAMAHRAAAEVALHEGAPTRAIEEASLSVELAESSAAHVDTAISRVVLGRALIKAGETALAVVELEQAAADFNAFGAVRFRDEAERELRKLGQRIHRRSRPGTGDVVGVHALSGRELEVARLVVHRRTNPEIAADLFLSLKTVETHMRNIFRKLDVTSRVQVALAIERGAPPDAAPAAPQAPPVHPKV